MDCYTQNYCCASICYMITRAWCRLRQKGLREAVAWEAALGECLQHIKRLGKLPGAWERVAVFGTKVDKSQVELYCVEWNIRDGAILERTDFLGLPLIFALFRTFFSFQSFLALS